MATTWGSGGWIKRLLAEDFSAICKEDRFCVPCAAAFCHHCCGAHHRGQGHEVVVRAEGTQQAEGEAEPGAAQGHSGSRGRDSFCVTCSAGFSAALCSHHSGHDTFRIDVFDGRYCARCTGSEPWFHLFDGIDTYYDEKKNHILVPLHPRRRCVDRCSSGGWIRRLLAEDFSISCKEDSFCVPCAAAFCHHCCGAHHRGQGHEVVVRAEETQQVEGEAEPGAAQGHSGSRVRDRDSFCVSCGAGFSAALCSHHSGHETLCIDVFDGRYCARCTGSEPWFHLFTDIHTYYDEKGHRLIPLHPRRRCGGRT